MMSLNSYKATEVLVTADMNQALAKALEEQQSDVISADTIQVFNNHLQIEDGGLALQEGRFVNAKGSEVKLTPMQQQLMEMLWQSPSHQLSKAEICDALWPKKPDASETLYTLIRRLKPIIEEQSDLKIESDRGKSYSLKIR